MSAARLAAFAAASVLLCAGNLTAKAYTAEEVAEKARQAGWPEELIQVGYNDWSSGNCTQEQLDQAYAEVEAYDAELSAEEKADLLADTADRMGLHVSVDEMAEDHVSLTVRNAEGRIVEKTAVGMMVDETGISYTAPLLTAALGVFCALSGFAGLYLYQRHMPELHG